ncbi:MAG: alpha/beta hydrolase [Planctomycetaceae bacterium]|nr:MAG: alpha/beta hydrolase [Planctomycetaceae bacterium]
MKMVLDPQAQALLDQFARSGVKPLSEVSLQDAREQMLVGSCLLGPGEEVHQVEDLEAPGPAGSVPIRLYRPRADRDLPTLVYLHGGGWIMGSIATHDALCRTLCRRSDMAIASVGYRLAPEHKFPAGLEDCFAAVGWLAQQAQTLGLDAGRLTVGGDSAGANLAASVILLARERGGPAIAFQLLIYPVTDFDFETPSYRENAYGFHLTRDDMIWCWRQYLANDLDGYTPLASPLRIDDLRGFPPAMVITAQYDPLRDEGEAYADRLAQAGVSVTRKCYAGMIHGFIRRPKQLDQAQIALDEIAATLKMYLSLGSGLDL